MAFEVLVPLKRVLAEVTHDNDVRVVVLTGAGRGFCSGGDRKVTADRVARGEELSHGPGYSPRPFYRAQQLFTTLEKPLIAAVNGPAVGGGMDLALWCDLRVASEHASFGELYIDRGLVPDMGGLFLLPRIVGRGNALYLLLTGEQIGAQEALRIGLVNRVVPHEQLLAAARELALKICAKPVRGVFATKRALARLLAPDWERESDYHAALQEALISTRDFREADRAFVEKRAPAFRGE